MEGNEPKKGSKMKYSPTGKNVKWQKTDNGIVVTLPDNLPANQPAVAFEFNP